MRGKKSYFDSFECQEILTCQLMSFWGSKHFKFADFLNQIVESDVPLISFLVLVNKCKKVLNAFVRWDFLLLLYTTCWKIGLLVKEPFYSTV